MVALEFVKKIISILFVAIGLLNLYPVVGVISADQLTSLYGISIGSADLETLMRHRAVMLGLIGSFLLLAAFRSSIQILAASIGLVSMSSFVILAYLAGDIGADFNNVVVADIVGSIAAALVLVMAVKRRRNSP